MNKKNEVCVLCNENNITGLLDISSYIKDKKIKNIVNNLNICDTCLIGWGLIMLSLAISGEHEKDILLKSTLDDAGFKLLRMDRENKQKDE